MLENEEKNGRTPSITPPSSASPPGASTAPAAVASPLGDDIGAEHGIEAQVERYLRGTAAGAAAAAARDVIAGNVSFSQYISDGGMSGLLLAIFNMYEDIRQNRAPSIAGFALEHLVVDCMSSVVHRGVSVDDMLDLVLPDQLQLGLVELFVQLLPEAKSIRLAIVPLLLLMVRARRTPVATRIVQQMLNHPPLPVVDSTLIGEVITSMCWGSDDQPVLLELLLEVLHSLQQAESAAFAGALAGAGLSAVLQLVDSAQAERLLRSLELPLAETPADLMSLYSQASSSGDFPWPDAVASSADAAVSPEVASSPSAALMSLHHSVAGLQASYEDLEESLHALLRLQ